MSRKSGQKRLFSSRDLLACQETATLKRQLLALYELLDYEGVTGPALSGNYRRRACRRVAQLSAELRRRSEGG